MATIIIIPSRLGSTRLKRKALIEIANKPLIRHVVESALKSRVAKRVILATDHSSIASVVKDLPIDIAMTQQNFRCGSDRVAFVAQDYPWADQVINLQGDELGVDRTLLLAALDSLTSHPMGTVAATLSDLNSFKKEKYIQDPNVVKVLFQKDQSGIYHARDFFRAPPTVEQIKNIAIHLGIYAFRLSSLAKFARLPYSQREDNEKLEQLRAVEAGWSIGLSLVEKRVISINHPNDLERLDLSVTRCRDAEELKRGELSTNG